MLDTVKTIETPEGVELELRIAGPGPRMVAWLMDTAIALVAIMFASFVFAWLGNFGTGLNLIFLFLTMWFYNVVFEATTGATPGKKLSGLAVTHDDGTPVGWSGAIVRNFLRAVDALPLPYTFGLISMLLNRDFKRLGDLAAGTLVIHVEREKKGNKLNVSKIPAFQPKSPPIPLTLYEQKNMVQFAERSANLSQARLIELAELLHPVTGLQGREGAEEIMKYANWVVGRR